MGEVHLSRIVQKGNAQCFESTSFFYELSVCVHINLKMNVHEQKYVLLYECKILNPGDENEYTGSRYPAGTLRT